MSIEMLWCIYCYVYTIIYSRKLVKLVYFQK